MMRIRLFSWLILLACGAIPVVATAQAAPPRMQIDGDTQVMLAAMQKVMQRDFRGAEELYGKAIAINPGNIEAWLQRALMRRELNDAAGTAADARQVVLLANRALALRPNDANLYYHRGMGYRFLRDFPDAERDIARAIRMSGQESWKTDLQATELEEKEAQ
ncbi:MAG: hypothetical protein KGJ21_06810 [Pseudomonadota bacterium]|nr:hypothetical protein [Pseudomonadota bacterium]